MQAQAIRFAREMQQRATPQINSEPPKSPPSPPKQDFPYPNNLFGHRNQRTHEHETPFCSSACPVKNILGRSVSSGGDNDIMLLMALLLVLCADGGDRMLMMALLYIMT